jgi:hypothetical protein
MKYRLKYLPAALAILLLLTGCAKPNGNGTTLPDPLPVPDTSQINREDVPDFILENHVDLQEQTYAALQLEGVLYLFASMGQQPSGGYSIAFVSYRDRKDHSWDVFLETVSPKTGDPVNTVITHPAAFARFHPQLPVFQVRFFINGTEAETVTVQAITAPPEETEVILFFGTPDAYLKTEPRPLPSSFLTAGPAGKAEMLIQELLKGTMAQFGTVHVIPEGTELKNIDYNPSTRLISVTLSTEFARLNGSAGETLGVFSIVNTLTQLEEIDIVTIIIEDGELQHMDNLTNLTYNEEMMADQN